MPKVHVLNVKSVKRRLPRMSFVSSQVRSSYTNSIIFLYDSISFVSRRIELNWCVVFLLIGAYSETRDMDFVR